MFTVMQTVKSSRNIVMAVLAACALNACSSTGGDVQTHFYVLDALPAGMTALEGKQRKRPVSIDIAALRLPQYLQRPQIVTRTSNNELKLAEYHQWGGNLAKNMMRIIARNLAQLLNTTQITVFSRRPATPPDVRVEIDVLRFELAPDSRVHLSAQWRTATDSEGATTITTISDYYSDPLASPAKMDATVRAMSELTGRLSTDIAYAVIDNVP
jgi:uncharacterized lipoprotein YmbA